MEQGVTRKKIGLIKVPESLFNGVSKARSCQQDSLAHISAAAAAADCGSLLFRAQATRKHGCLEDVP